MVIDSYKRSNDCTCMRTGKMINFSMEKSKHDSKYISVDIQMCEKSPEN